MWRWIEGYEGKYKVSDRGEVFSIASNSIMKQQETCGYKVVFLRKGKKYKKYRVHRLVANSFVKNTDGKPHVNYIDEDRTNNYYKNLEWVTPLENDNYGNRNKHISENISSKVKILAEKGNEKLYFNSLTEAENSGIGVTVRGISSVLHEHQHTHRGYKFKVVE